MKQVNEGTEPQKNEEGKEPEGVQVDFIGIILNKGVITDSTMEKDQAVFWEDFIKCHPATLEKLITGFLGMAGMENLIEDVFKMYGVKHDDL